MVDQAIDGGVGVWGLWVVVVHAHRDGNGVIVSGDEDEKPCETETIEDRIINNLPVVDRVGMQKAPLLVAARSGGAVVMVRRGSLVEKKNYAMPG